MTKPNTHYFKGNAIIRVTVHIMAATKRPLGLFFGDSIDVPGQDVIFGIEGYPAPSETPYSSQHLNILASHDLVTAGLYAMRSDAAGWPYWGHIRDVKLDPSVKLGYETAGPFESFNMALDYPYWLAPGGKQYAYEAGSV